MLLGLLPVIPSSVGRHADDVIDAIPPAKYVYDVRTHNYRDVATGRFVAEANLPWPKPNGFGADPMPITLPKGFEVDRYGKLSGHFAGTPGTSISARGLPPGSEGRPYTRLRVINPIEVLAGPASGVPEFGATGGGMQYFFERSLESYLGDFLEKVE